MPKAYSRDLRERVIETVEMGASRHESAEHFGMCGSSVAPGQAAGAPSVQLRWPMVGAIVWNGDIEQEPDPGELQQGNYG